MGKNLSVSLTDDDLADAEALTQRADGQSAQDMAAALPSVSKAKKANFVKGPNVQMNFGVPAFIRDAFKAEAKRLGMKEKEYFYHLMRESGLSIPSYQELDGRRK